MFEKIGFIGCGNMGSAIATAVAKATDPKNIYISNRRPEKVAEFVKSIGANMSTNEKIAEECTLIFLGVKPQMASDLFDEIAPILKNRQHRFVLVSMMAGIDMESLTKLAGGEFPIVRIMPNTPALIGKGVTQLCYKNATVQEVELIKIYLDHTGIVDQIPEKLLNASMAISGCGTAFVCMFIEALADGAVSCGLPRDTAYKYAAQTLSGMAELMLHTGEHPAVLKDKVCSPGGVTIAGVKALEDGAFRAAAMNAVVSAYQKAVDMEKGN